MKKLSSILLAFALLFNCSITALANEGEIRVTVDGVNIQFDQPVVTLNGRTMVPIRQVVEQLDCTVEWDADTQTVYINTSDVPVSKTAVLGEHIQVQVNNEAVEFPDQQPVILSGRTLLPVRFVVEKLDCEVLWDDGVLIHSPGYEPAARPDKEIGVIVPEQFQDVPGSAGQAQAADDTQREVYLAYVDDMLGGMQTICQRLMTVYRDFNSDADMYSEYWLEEIGYQIDLLIELGDNVAFRVGVEDIPYEFLEFDLLLTQTFMYLFDIYDIVMQGYVDDDLYVLRQGASLAEPFNELIEACIEARNAIK